MAVPTDPTVAGTVWDPYDDMQNFLQTPPLLYGREGSVLGGAAAAKPDGAFAGWTTDRGQGFSGIAGVVMRAWESFCLGIDAVCAGQEWTSSPPIGGSVVVYSATGQLVAPAGPTTVLPFTYAAAIPQGVGASAAFVNTFTLVGVDGVWGTPDDVAAPFGAYTATQDFEDPFFGRDGYRDQESWSYDRAGNRSDFQVTEGVADHTNPIVGNVNMPTPVVYTLGTDYVFGGETQDNVDLKETDFSFDFNSIMSLQPYNLTLGLWPPGLDAKSWAYDNNSLQLPLDEIDHTLFGSGGVGAPAGSMILRHEIISSTVPFLGCLIRFDEEGLATVPSWNPTRTDFGPMEPYTHVARGPRWRTWDHADAYGLVNTQFNTFVISSIPGCGTVASQVTGLLPPVPYSTEGAGFAGDYPPTVLDDGVTLGIGPGPDVTFGTADDGTGPDGIHGTLDDDAGWTFEVTGTALKIVLKGTTSIFVPNLDFSAITVYYLDAAGRVRIVEGGSWSGPLVSDVGTGAFGRWYEYTFVWPSAPIVANFGNPAGADGTNAGYFFVYRTSAGHALIWDETANPIHCDPAPALFLLYGNACN